MARTKKKTNVATLKMAVTDINELAGAITLEGIQDEVKYALLIDYDNEIKEYKPASTLAIGSVFEIGFEQLPYEVAIDPSQGIPVVLTPKAGQVCPGSGTVGKTYKDYPSFGNRVNSLQCPHCNKRVSLNTPEWTTGANGKYKYEAKFRKHKA